MGGALPTFERRQLGLALRRVRDKAGKTQQDAAQAVGKARTRIVQLEDGTATFSEDDLIKLLDCFGVDGDERDTILELGAHARARLRPRVRVDHLPEAYLRFADLEASASEIHCYETGIVPGILQSESYMRTVVAEGAGIWWEPEAAEGQDRLAYREQRQHRVLESSDGRIMRFVITEDALRANLGEPQVMKEQLQHLLGLLRRNRDLTIRVLRNDVVGNPLRGRGFWIFDFEDRGAPVAVSPILLGPSVYYDSEGDLAALRRAFYRTWELALSRHESKRLIEAILKE